MEAGSVFPAAGRVGAGIAPAQLPAGVGVQARFDAFCCLVLLPAPLPLFSRFVIPVQLVPGNAVAAIGALVAYLADLVLYRCIGRLG